MAIPSWKEVGISMQTALAAAKTITAITKANPGQITSAAHGFSNGDFYLLSVQGMYELNSRVEKAASVATDTLALSGLYNKNTTNYNTFSSGTMQKITFGATFATLQNPTPSGGETEDIDVTTIHDAQRVVEPGLRAPSVFTFDSLFEPDDPGLTAALQASETDDKRAFLFSFKTGHKYAFYGRVDVSDQPKGQFGGKVQTSVKITASSRGVWFAP